MELKSNRFLLPSEDHYVCWLEMHNHYGMPTLALPLSPSQDNVTTHCIRTIKRGRGISWGGFLHATLLFRPLNCVLFLSRSLAPLRVQLAEHDHPISSIIFCRPSPLDLMEEVTFLPTFIDAIFHLPLPLSNSYLHSNQDVMKCRCC